MEKNFSKEKDINFKELYKYIHYTFKNEDLLRDALCPLLPVDLWSSEQDLRRSEQKYNYLGFLGDSVLDLIIKQHIINLFPNEKIGMHDKLCSALTCNKTLAEAYQKNLKIESYLPYPRKKVCKYCDVVEAIIGAIFVDNPGNELVPTRTFILKVLDVDLFLKKCKELLAEKKVKGSGESSGQNGQQSKQGQNNNRKNYYIKSKL